jgi:pantothenate kinase
LTEDLAKLVAMVTERAAGREVLLVAIAGGVAVGKSTLARTLAQALEATGHTV